MGAWSKIATALLGVLLVGGPLWPGGVICFAFLGLALLQKRSARVGPGTRRSGVRPRHAVALLFFVLSGAAFVSGGTLSPVAFAIVGGVAFFWSRLASLSPAREVVPVEDSIVFRSKYLPLAWYALEELKPGSDPFPRALSSFSGTLLVFTDTGRTYALAACFALGREGAEANLSEQLRASSLQTRSGAFPFPLDSRTACDVLRRQLRRVNLHSGNLSRAAADLSGVLVLRCASESVREAGAYQALGQGGRAKVPGRGRALESPPLLWEVLEWVGKRTRWPDPDSCSSLLDSLNVTRGVPLGDRLKAIEESGSGVSLRSLGGAEVCVTRPQLRALVSIYS